MVLETTESVNLILKTNHISASNTITDYYNTTITNSNGTIKNNFCSITWNNVDMVDLLGNLYDKYNKFNISLLYVSGTAIGSGTPGANRRFLYAKMGGLPFENTYDQLTKTTTDKAIISLIHVNAGALDQWCNMDTTKTYHCFKKPSDNVNLSIDLICTFSDVYPDYADANSLFRHLTFAFAITGVNDDDDY